MRITGATSGSGGGGSTGSTTGGVTGGEREFGHHLALFGPRAHQVGASTPAEHEAETVEQDRLARPGFTGQHIETRLEGKLHIYVGDMDNYYLNNAVYLAEEFLESTTNPYYNGEVDYGNRFEHCWNGDHENPNHISRLRYNTMYLERILKRIEATAPEGADLTSWRY